MIKEFVVCVVCGRCTGPCTDHVEPARRSPQLTTINDLGYVANCGQFTVRR